jgi:hypothetical protein
VGLEQGSLNLVSEIEEILGRKSSSSGIEILEYRRRGSAPLTTLHPSVCKLDTNFSDKRRSLGRYTSLADSGHGAQFSNGVKHTLIYISNFFWALNGKKIVSHNKTRDVA